MSTGALARKHLDLWRGWLPLHVPAAGHPQQRLVWTAMPAARRRCTAAAPLAESASAAATRPCCCMPVPRGPRPLQWLARLRQLSTAEHGCSLWSQVARWDWLVLCAAAVYSPLWRAARHRWPASAVRHPPPTERPEGEPQTPGFMGGRGWQRRMALGAHAHSVDMQGQ